MVRTKVFVGNLSFNTKENELAKEFEVGGKVISANIITRGPRSLGYGFVEMDNEADAENAVKLLNKKEIDGRAINVEVAKPREEGAEGQAAQTQDGEAKSPSSGRGGRGGRGGARGGRGRGFGGRGFGRGGNGSGERRFRRRDGSDEDGEGEQQQQQQPAEGGEARRGRGGARGASRGRGRGGAKRGREPRGEDTRTPSSTTLFVSNLPFAYDDEAFGKVLKDASLAFKTAHVVKRKTGSSKGYGFAVFDNEADQQKALTALNNKSIEGREIAVKVALTQTTRPEGENAPAAVKTENTEQKA